MQDLFVEGVLGKTVDVSSCLTCRAFWFEPYEDLQLTRASTLKLFKLIAEQASTPRPPFPTKSYCQVCKLPLLLSHDRQRTTAFQYWRCDAGHGRFMAFVDFLREKEFVKALTPQQISELRQNIQMISCSCCGGSIDLTSQTVCPHCGAQVSILDSAKLRELAAPAGRPMAPLSAQPLPPAMRQAPGDMSDLIDSHRQASAPKDSSLFNLIDLGLMALGGWLQNLSDE